MKISDIVNNFLMENGLSESEYIRCFQIARKGLTDIQKDFGGVLVRECANVNSNGTIDFPKEAVKVYNVGFIRGDDFIPYTVNSNLGDTPSKCKSCKEYSYSCECEPRGEHGMAETLGIGSWNNFGEYNIKNRVIYLSQDIICEDIYIEYSTYDQTEVDNHVEPIYEEVVGAYLAWRFFRARPNTGLSEKRDYELDYKKERRKAKLRKNSLSRAQLNQLARQHTKLGLKS